ncbi:DegT/DnrJ/EryC1/StrS family aminotransferase, partial [Candidatus Sumerlaeota bacterium]|nr:DegT/DnrJ/EryC1/StrS family aminotransferase [Candidatus Sumerlaeota bacterium]
MGNLALIGGKPVRTKPFVFWPVFGKEEEKKLLDVFRSGKWWYGEKVKEFEESFAAFHKAKYGVSCCNGTIAIQIALKTLGIGAGDEVLVPAYTFIATASAVIHSNAVPIFVDVDENTINMDLNQAEKLITDKTRAIMVVHFAGLPIDMDRVNAIAKKHNLKVVEDAAHSWGTQWKGKGAGALGDMGTFSFQMSKNITAGEGGVILTNNKEYADTARSITNCGRHVGQPWYAHYLVGGNYRLTELQAAVLLGQMTRLEKHLLKRQENAEFLNAELGKIPGIVLPETDKRVTRRAYHLYLLRYLQNEFGGLPRERFIEALKAEGLPASGGYLTPVHKNHCFLELKSARGKQNCPLSCPYYGKKVDYSKVSMPVAEKLCK